MSLACVSCTHGTREITVSTEFIAGSRCLLADRVVEIDGPISQHHVQVRDLNTGQLLSTRLEALRSLPASRREHDPLVIPQAEWDRAVPLAQALTPYMAGTLPGPIARELAKRFAISVRQLQRAAERYRLNPQATALVRRAGGRPKGLRLLQPEVEHIIQHMIAKHYARRESASQSEVCDRVRLTCQRLCLPAPDPKTVNARIHAEEEVRLAYKRLGGKAARQRFEPRPGSLAAAHALALVQIDHTRADIQLVDENDPSRVIGRPWLTLAVDVATRAVAGYYLSMEAPSAISVAMCVAHMLLPKAENAVEAGLWPMYGTPIRILVDNGKDLRSIAIQRGCEQHGIDLTWRPVRQPHYGGHIERLMGTFMRRVHTLPGTTFSHSKQKGDYPSERKACLTLEDFRLWLVEQICHGYHLRRHRGIGMPPLLAWERSFVDEDGERLPAPPSLDGKAVRRDFYPFVYRRMQRTGVQYGRSRYWHASLAPLVHPHRVVRVHYRPGDDSRVWVRDDDNLLIEAPAVAGPALREGIPVAIDATEQARIDHLRLLGYERMDAIRTEAERRKRKPVDGRCDQWRDVASWVETRSGLRRPWSARGRRCVRRRP
jgi:putative transposase